MTELPPNAKRIKLVYQYDPNYGIVNMDPFATKIPEHDRKYILKEYEKKWVCGGTFETKKC